MAEVVDAEVSKDRFGGALGRPFLWGIPVFVGFADDLGFSPMALGRPLWSYVSALIVTEFVTGCTGLLDQTKFESNFSSERAGFASSPEDPRFSQS